MKRELMALFLFYGAFSEHDPEKPALGLDPWVDSGFPKNHASTRIYGPSGSKRPPIMPGTLILSRARDDSARWKAVKTA
jgi:hypothetical protein